MDGQSHHASSEEGCEHHLHAARVERDERQHGLYPGDRKYYRYPAGFVCDNQRVQQRIITHRDTVVTKPRKKGFFRRLGEVFVPPKKDTAIQGKDFPSKYAHGIR